MSLYTPGEDSGETETESLSIRQPGGFSSLSCDSEHSGDMNDGDSEYREHEEREPENRDRETEDRDQDPECDRRDREPEDSDQEPEYRDGDPEYHDNQPEEEEEEEYVEPKPGPSGAPCRDKGHARKRGGSSSTNPTSGPSGPNWERLPGYLACPCGLLVDKKKISRHISESCRLNPCPLVKIRQNLKDTVTWKRVDAERRATCPKCKKTIKAAAKTTMARAIATHLCKQHRDLSSRKRDKIRRKMFNKRYVLTAKDVPTAVVTGLKVDSEAFQELQQSQESHGSSRAQATAPSRAESREEYLLRNSVRVHPEPQSLFTIQGLFAEVAQPSKSTMGFLRAIEREMRLNVLDWRYVFAITENRRRVREHLCEVYQRSGQSGFMRANSLRKYVTFVRGHLAEMTDGNAWRPLVDMMRDLLDAVLKENSQKVDKARGEREVRHITEERLSHPNRMMIEKAVVQSMEKVKAQELPETERNLRRSAVWFRQAAYVALSVNLAHRTGVYEQMTKQEFEDAVQTEDGRVINHIGGKTRGTYRTVQVPIGERLFELIQWYLTQLQPCLGRSEQAGLLLFPHLNAFDPELLNLRIPEIEHLNYQRLLRGNRTRRHNVELATELDERRELEGTNLRELAALRCHTEAVAARSYDARNKARRAARAHKALMRAANKRYGMAESDNDEDMSEDSLDELLSTTKTRKRYATIYSDSDDEPQEKRHQESGLGDAGNPSTPGHSDHGGAGDGPPTPPTAVQSDHGGADEGTSTPAPSGLAAAGHDAPATPLPPGLSLGDTERDSNLIVDDEILPYVEKIQRSEPASHSRSGKQWTTVERATLLLALNLGIADGKGKGEKVKRFLQGRPGWNMTARPPLSFQAQLAKLRRQYAKKKILK